MKSRSRRLGLETVSRPDFDCLDLISVSEQNFKRLSLLPITKPISYQWLWLTSVSRKCQIWDFDWWPISKVTAVKTHPKGTADAPAAPTQLPVVLTVVSSVSVADINHILPNETHSFSSYSGRRLQCFRFHYTLVVVQVFFIQLHNSLSVLLLSAREVSVDKNNTTWCSLRQAWHRCTERIHPRTPKTLTLLVPCPAYQTCWPTGTHPRPLQTHRISSHTEILCQFT